MSLGYASDPRRLARAALTMENLNFQKHSYLKSTEVMNATAAFVTGLFGSVLCDDAGACAHGNDGGGGDDGVEFCSVGVKIKQPLSNLSAAIKMTVMV